MVSQTPRDPSAAPDERVALLLAAAAAPAEPGPQPGEEQALAAFRASPHRTRRISMYSTPRRAKIAVASTVGAGALLFAGVGAAAAGVLPDAAQDTASTWLSTLGIEVPNAHAGEHPTAGDSDEADETDTDTTETESTDTDTDETEADATETDATETETDATETETDATETESSAGKGADVSGLATSTESTGVDKGAEISTLASGGKSRAGADHTAPQQTQGGGAAASGAGTADQASSGHSAAGSQNRP